MPSLKPPDPRPKQDGEQEPMTRQWYGNQKVVEGWYGRIGGSPLSRKGSRTFSKQYSSYNSILRNISELYFQP